MAPMNLLGLLVVAALLGCASSHGSMSKLRDDCRPVAVLERGARPPRESRPGCLSENIVLDPLVKSRGARAVARWVVCADGSVGTFSLDAIADPGAKMLVHQAVWRAVVACEWAPGADPTGRAVDMWMTAPIQFQGLPR